MCTKFYISSKTKTLGFYGFFPFHNVWKSLFAKAWGDVLRNPLLGVLPIVFSEVVGYYVLLPFVADSGSHSTLNHCTESKRAVLCICLLNKWHVGEGIFSILSQRNKLESIQNNPACLDHSFIKHFWCVCFDFFVVCLKKTSMEIASDLSSCWLSQKFFYITVVLTNSQH